MCDSVQDLNEQTLKVSPTLRVQGVFQGDVVLLQVHVLHRFQVDLRVGNEDSGASITLIFCNNYIFIA